MMSDTAIPDWFASLPQDKQDEFAAVVHIFAHDLRQPLGQIFSAEELLRRSLNKGEVSPDLIELLDIIREANRNASGYVDTFVESILDGLEPPEL